jgi:hypothetical protein
MANIGTIDCGTFPGLVNYTRSSNGRTPGLGAFGKGNGAYRGEAYVVDGKGTATITRWSPNAVDVLVEGADPGEHVILNQNWDPGWSASTGRVLDWRDTVAAPITAPTQTVRFRYVPRMLGLGLAVFFLTVAALVVPSLLRWRARRKRRHFAMTSA